MMRNMPSVRSTQLNGKRDIAVDKENVVDIAFKTPARGVFDRTALLKAAFQTPGEKSGGVQPTVSQRMRSCFLSGSKYSYLSQASENPLQESKLPSEKLAKHRAFARSRIGTSST